MPALEDFWLFDSIRVARLHFDDDRLLGAAVVTDPASVGEANRLRDIAWHYAIPYPAWIKHLEGDGDQYPGRP